MKQFNAAVEATDVLVHRQRLGHLHDMRASQAQNKDFAQYVSSLNKARRRGR